MSVWLFEGSLSVVFFVALIPLVAAPFVHAVYKRYRFLAPVPTLMAAAAGLYACALVAFTLFPLPDPGAGFCDGRTLSEYWQLTPGETFGDVVDALRVNGAAALTGGTFLQVFFNVVFFVPLGFFIGWWRGGRLRAALLAGVALSLLIEATQGTGLWWVYPCPYRLGSVDDVITNTLGAGVGWILGAALARWLPYRPPAPRPALAPPTIRRRLLANGLDLLVAVLVTIVLELVVLFAVEARGGDPDASLLRWALLGAQLFAGLTVLGAVPVVRRDRATPGQASTLLALARHDSDAPAPQWAAAVRFGVRWFPMLVLGGLWALAVLVADSVTVAARSDRRSLTAVLARSRTVPRDRLTLVRAPEQERQKDATRRSGSRGDGRLGHDSTSDP